MQDRLILRIRSLGCDAPPRFFEGPGGRLAFRLRVGWRARPALLRGLERIDEVVHPAG